MPGYRGNTGFTSPGAAFSDAIQELMVQREVQKRQAMLDALNVKKESAMEQDRADARRLEATREARIAADADENRKNLEKERQYRRASNIAETSIPGDELDQETVDQLRTAGLSGVIRTVPAKDADTLGIIGNVQGPTEGSGEGTILPNRSVSRGGTRFLTMKEQADARAAAAQAAQAAAADRADADRASREAIAREGRASREAIAAAAAANHPNTQGEQSYKYQQGRLDKMRKPYEDAEMRLGRLNESLAAGTPQADALVAPELLTVMAGGAGSGLRMNEAEISRIVGGRSNWESLKAAANKWRLDPGSANSITPAQRGQIHQLMDAVQQRYQGALKVLDEAGDNLTMETDPMKHRQIVNKAQKALVGSQQGLSTPAPMTRTIRNTTTGETKTQTSTDGGATWK